MIAARRKPFVPNPSAMASLGKTPLCVDLLEQIINVSDQATLYAWQRVSLVTYHMVTPLLYSRPIELKDGTSHKAYFAKFFEKHPLPGASPRLVIEGFTMPYPTAIKTDSFREFADHSIHLNCLESLWITQQGLAGVSGDANSLLAKQVPAEIKRLHVGTSLTLQGHDFWSSTTWIPRNLELCRVYNHLSNALYVCNAGLADVVEYVVPTASFDPYDILRHLLGRLPTTKPQTLEIYGIGAVPPRWALHRCLVYAPASEAILHSPGYICDINGNEAECQVAVQRTIMFWLDRDELRQWIPRLRFKLSRELQPFY